MIRTLKKRLSVMVVAGLFLASAILVIAINGMNLRSLTNQTESVLAMLWENGGQRPVMRELEQNVGAQGSDVPQKPEGTPPPRPEGTVPPEMPAGRGKDPRGERILRAADLSTYYLVHLKADGSVEGWESERPELFTDEQIAAFVSEAAAQGKTVGRIGNSFYRKTDDLLIVLDAQVEMQNAEQFLRVTAAVALVQWAVLSAGAVWLIRRMVKPVDEAMEKQKQFVWDASHELKTPLAVISANAEVLAGEVGDHPSLGYIQSEVRRTDQLIQNLLTLARMEKGTVKVQLKKFDLSRALWSVALPFESAAFEAGKRLETEIPEEISCTGDEEMIKQLVLILLSNAAKYADAGGVITLSLEAKGDKRLIRVHNTGSFIPPKEQEKIFDRFYRVDSSHNRETPGNGLGLAIARDIAEAHKGKITVRSGEKTGTEFTVTI